LLKQINPISIMLILFNASVFDAHILLHLIMEWRFLQTSIFQNVIIFRYFYLRYTFITYFFITYFSRVR